MHDTEQQHEILCQSYNKCNYRSFATAFNVKYYPCYKLNLLIPQSSQPNSITLKDENCTGKIVRSQCITQLSSTQKFSLVVPNAHWLMIQTMPATKRVS